MSCLLWFHGVNALQRVRNMGDEPFVMLSLKGDKAKKLAHALTNKSADKILTYLANKKSATESQVAKALKLPVSTVNYTMKVLVEAKLVVAEEYHYSTKGREVNHYKLAKKYIIIAPDDDENFFQRIKKYVPAFGITIGVAGIIRFFQALTTPVTVTDNALRTTPLAVGSQAMDAAADAITTEGVTKTTEVIQATPLVQTLFADWFLYFLLGALAFFLLIMLFERGK